MFAFRLGVATVLVAGGSACSSGSPSESEAPPSATAGDTTSSGTTTPAVTSEASVEPDVDVISWRTDDVTLTAESFYVEANGLRFTADGSSIDVHSDPIGDGDDTTLELTWFEHDREMRLNLYLEVLGPETWGSKEIRVYDGSEEPDWVYFEQRHFEVPAGEAFSAGSFELTDETGTTVHFEGLVIRSPLDPSVNDYDGSAETVAPRSDEPAVGMPIDIGDEFAVADLTMRLDDAYFDCQQVQGLSLCPADLADGDQPVTLHLARVEGDSATFESLPAELVDRAGTRYPYLAGSAQNVEGETVSRFMTFGVAEATNELEIAFDSGERYDLRRALPTPDDSDEGAVSADSFFRDDFDGSLDPTWQWWNEDATHWSLTDADGWLSIVAQDSGTDAPINLLVRPLEPPLGPESMSIFTTRVAFEPTSNFQFAGLAITPADSASERVQFGRAFCDDFHCALDGLYFDHLVGGEIVGQNHAIPFADTPELFIQLALADSGEGDWVVLAAFSFDGVEWNYLGEHRIEFEPARVGLIAGQAPTELLAAFDFFEFEQIR